MRRTWLSTFVIAVLSVGIGHASIAADQEAVTAEKPDSQTIRFNFQGATFQQVIDFFSRTTGLPVIWQTPPPEGKLDYISPANESYDQAQALRILNVILQSKGVALRVTKDNLFLQKLDQMQREDLPTFIGVIPADVTPDQIITVIRPMKIAMAKPLAERLSTMVAAYGAVTAMEQQNSLVITETAANAQRLLTIIDQLDRDDPEGAVEIFAIRHAIASELLASLKSLMSQRVEKFVINQQGHQVKIEEDQLPGLSISSDDRTNSIIAKGVQNKIEKLREAILLLDVPAASQARSMTTIGLSRLTPAEAAAKLNLLYQKMVEKNRPTVLALDDAGKVMIVGADAAISEGTLLIAELENDPVNSKDESIMTVLPLEWAAPGNVIASLNGLLSKRQQVAVKLVAGPDGKSLVISGPASDVADVKGIVPVLDRSIETPGDIHVLTIVNADANQLAANLDAMFTVPGAAGTSRPTIRVDAPSNSLLVRASESQLQSIRDVVAKIDMASVVSSRQMRLIPVDPSKSTADDLAQTLQRMLDQGEGTKVKVMTLEELIKQRETAPPPVEQIKSGGGR